MIPSDPAHATPEWLTAALRDSELLATATVVDVLRERVGVGLVGQNVRFTLTYDSVEDGAPVSVVGKFPSPEPVSRATGVAMRNYEREVRFYQEVAPTVAITTPRCHFAGIDLATGDFCLLFEDLAPAEAGDQVSGCTEAQAELALRELAGLHGPLWDDPSLDKLDFLSTRDASSGRAIEDLYRSCWPGFLAVYETVLPRHGVELGERFGASLAGWVTRYDGPPCVVHGDYRLDNMMFGTVEGGYPLAVVDWQTCGIGAGAYDAAYFVGAGLLSDARRQHEEALLHAYHDALVDRGVDSYSFDRFRDDYRSGTLSGVLMSVVASMVVAADERGVAMFSAMASRHFEHALEWDALSLL